MSAVLDLSSHGVAIVGKVPSGFPSVDVPNVSAHDLPGLVIGVVSMILLVIPGLLVLRLDSSLIYTNATLVRDRVNYLVGACDPLPGAVVLDLGVNTELDVTSAETLEQLVAELRAAGIDFALADVRHPVIRRMKRDVVLEKIGDDRIYLTVEEAIQSLSPRVP